MDFTCANCKNRHCMECEDYHWGFWDARACKDNFELDIDTLNPQQKQAIQNIARLILKSDHAYNNYY